MKFIVLLIASFLLSACQTTYIPKGKDKYRFETKQYENTSFRIEFVILKDRKEFNDVARRHVKAVGGLKAFSRIVPEEDKCIIYIRDPEWKYEPEFIGHEVAHCIWGQWHPSVDTEETIKQ